MHNSTTIGILIHCLWGGSITSVVLTISSVNSVVQKELRTNVLRVEKKRVMCQENINGRVRGVSGKKRV